MFIEKSKATEGNIYSGLVANRSATLQTETQQLRLILQNVRGALRHGLQPGLHGRPRRRRGAMAGSRRARSRMLAPARRRRLQDWSQRPGASGWPRLSRPGPPPCLDDRRPYCSTACLMSHGLSTTSSGGTRRMPSAPKADGGTSAPSTSSGHRPPSLASG